MDARDMSLLGRESQTASLLSLSNKANLTPAASRASQRPDYAVLTGTVVRINAQRSPFRLYDTFESRIYCSLVAVLRVFACASMP